MLLTVFIFIVSLLVIVVSSKWVVDNLHHLCKRLGWKEFVVAFFGASVGAVVPEFIIGVRAALGGIPELALGNIVGQNIILFTMSVAICVFLLGEIVVESRTVRAGTTFALISVTLPFLLLWNGTLSRIDGVILILAFFVYIYWLFSERERFLKDYEITHQHAHPLRYLAVIFLGFVLIVFSSEGILYAAQEFAHLFNIPLIAIGLFGVGLGVALPETFFSVTIALKGHSWMILGGLMGAVAISSTLVLGTVAIIEPIVLDDFSFFRVARIFVVLSGALLLFFVRTHNKITRREAIFLFCTYLAFVFFYIFDIYPF